MKTKITIWFSLVFLLSVVNLKASSTFEEVFQFGQTTQQCSNGTVVTAFSLSEDYSYTDCETRNFKLSFFPLSNSFDFKCIGFEYTIYSIYMGTTHTEASGYFGEDYITTHPYIISAFFDINKHADEENYSYYIELEFVSPPSHVCQVSGMPCGVLPHVTSPNFKPNWSALPEDRHFTLDGEFSHATTGAVPPGGWATITKCNGDAMIFTLPQEVADDLNCIGCAGQYAGLTITKTDANHNSIDNTKFLGTQDWAISLGVSNSPDFVLEDFLDMNGNTEDIALLPLFNNYMTNNYGYYTLDFDYYSICGHYIERLYIEYMPTSLPKVDLLVPTSGFGFQSLQIPANNSETNPISTSCSFSGGYIYNPGISSIYGTVYGYKIMMERLDPTGYTIILNDIPLTWNALLNSTVSGISFNGLIYTFGSPSDALFPGSPNSTKIHHVKLTFSTECGDAYQDFWFYPNAGTCKNNEDISWYFEDYKNVESINLFPTISENEINIKWNNKDFTFNDLYVYNIDGKLIKTVKIHKEDVSIKKINFSIANLSKGLYFVELRGNTKTNRLRFIKK